MKKSTHRSKSDKKLYKVKESKGQFEDIKKVREDMTERNSTIVEARKILFKHFLKETNIYLKRWMKESIILPNDTVSDAIKKIKRQIKITTSL